MAGKPIILQAFANDPEGPNRYLKEIYSELGQMMSILQGAMEVQTVYPATRADVEVCISREKEAIKIFHFGGHASPEGLQMEAANQDVSEFLHKEGIANLLGIPKGIRLVFLNGCLTSGLVNYLHKNSIPCIIGANRNVGDEFAKQFATRFYQRFIEGNSIKLAFELAKSSMQGSHREESIRGVEPEHAYQLRFPFELEISKYEMAAGDETLAFWKTPKQSLITEFKDTPVISSGSKTYLLCNRDEHNTKFENGVKEAMDKKPRKPQFFFLHGPYDESPSMLVERFGEFSLANILERRKELIDPVRCIRYEVAFPKKNDFTHKDPNKPWLALGEAFDSKSLGNAPADGKDVIDGIGKNRRLVLIDHRTSADKWHENMEDFLYQYITNFWNLELEADQPQIAVVIHLTYHVKSGFKHFKSAWANYRIQSILERLVDKIRRKQGEDCTCFLLDKLGPVSMDEVADWQLDYMKGKDEWVDELFGKKAVLPMRTIKNKLIKLLA